MESDEYFTLDADWIIPALCRSVKVESPILEPCAGRGHMVHALRELGFVVRAADLYAYPDSLVPDINTGADVFELKSLAGYRFVVTNLPYREQAAILAHLLPIAARARATATPSCGWSRWRRRGGVDSLRRPNSSEDGGQKGRAKARTCRHGFPHFPCPRERLHRSRRRVSLARRRMVPVKAPVIWVSFETIGPRY
jgi:hypothetical protein